MLEFKNVSFSYKNSEETVLKDISFNIPDGSFVSIIGASGSGKSTIFRLLNGLEEPVTGSITLNGKNISTLGHFAGYMPQQDLLFPWRTVEQNVMLPMQIQHIKEEKRKEAADELLKKVGLADCKSKYPRELSGGMRQRVSFARTLAAGADLLLLDEPFSALDSITRISLQEWLREQWSLLDKTILFITHDVDEAIYLSEKVLVLSGQPVDSITQYDVPLPRIRCRDMLYKPETERLKETLTDILRKEAGI